MKLLFIYDNADLKTVTETVGRLVDVMPVADHKHILTFNEEGKRKLYDVAIDIKKEISTYSNYIIFIDQYLACADKEFEWLQRNAGVALIKFLRMLEVRDHIVLITPYAGKEIELVKQDPANLIVTSKGISFAKNLYGFKNQPVKELEKLTENKFDEKLDLKPYILAEFRLPEDERHNWANWWGIDRLWNIHRVVEKEKYGLKERWLLDEYPETLKGKLKELKNRQALFLYGHQEKVIVNRLEEHNEEIEKVKEKIRAYSSARDLFIENSNVIQSQINDKSLEREKYESRVSYINFRLPQLNGHLNSFLEKRAESIRKISELYQQISVLVKELYGDGDEPGEKQRIKGISNAITEKEIRLGELKNSLLEEEERYLSLIRAEIERLDNLIQTLESKILSLSISALRNKLKDKSPKILYIDDQASDGWSNIFQHIIYGKENNSNFEVIQPKEKDTINAEYFTNIVDKEIIKHNPDLILLDLRLNRESGVRVEVENLSGAVLLKEIRKHYPGIPVLMTTASNKSWSYEELQRIGCDAFWTKEGVDTGMTEADSVKNYLRFAELVNVLTGDDYKCMKEYHVEICKLENKGKTKQHWWQLPTRYKRVELEKVESDFVYKILKETSFIFNEYLASKVIRKTDATIWNEWFYASLVIQNLGKVVEKLHYHKDIEVGAYVIKSRQDHCGLDLFLKRNEASHIAPVVILKEPDAKKYMKDVISYLNDRDYCPTPGPKIVGKIDLK